MYVFSFHHRSHTVLIETLWNVKMKEQAAKSGDKAVLIETLWKIK